MWSRYSVESGFILFIIRLSFSAKSFRKFKSDGAFEAKASRQALVCDFTAARENGATIDEKQSSMQLGKWKNRTNKFTLIKSFCNENSLKQSQQLTHANSYVHAHNVDMIKLQ